MEKKKFSRLFRSFRGANFRFFWGEREIFFSFLPSFFLSAAKIAAHLFSENGWLVIVRERTRLFRLLNFRLISGIMADHFVRKKKMSFSLSISKIKYSIESLKENFFRSHFFGLIIFPSENSSPQQQLLNNDLDVIMVIDFFLDQIIESRCVRERGER